MFCFIAYVYYEWLQMDVCSPFMIGYHEWVKDMLDYIRIRLPFPQLFLFLMYLLGFDQINISLISFPVYFILFYNVWLYYGCDCAYMHILNVNVYCGCCIHLTYKSKTKVMR